MIFYNFSFKHFIFLFAKTTKSFDLDVELVLQ